MWTLEVIDGEGASTVWDDQFDTAAAAKAEFCGASLRRASSASFLGSPF